MSSRCDTYSPAPTVSDEPRYDAIDTIPVSITMNAPYIYKEGDLTSGGMKTYVFEVEIEQEGDGRWSATIPLLPGCATWGYTREEALQSLQEAARAYLEVLFDQGKALPKDVEKKVTVFPDQAIAVTVY